VLGVIVKPSKLGVSAASAGGEAVGGGGGGDSPDGGIVAAGAVVFGGRGGCGMEEGSAGVKLFIYVRAVTRLG